MGTAPDGAWQREAGVEHSAFVESFRSQQESLRGLERFRIDELGEADLPGITEKLWHLIAALKIGIGESKIVVGTKALHHLLPDLVPPIDRRYTVRFFFEQPNAIQGDDAKQRKKFCTMYPLLAVIAVACRESIQRRVSRAAGTIQAVRRLSTTRLWDMSGQN
jgi:hypothetical protein